MRLELISWVPESGGRLVKIDYKVNEKFRSMYVRDHQIEAVMLEHFSKEGVSQTNVNDFINGKDVKYKMEEYHQLFFIQHFHTI